jgi:hypothetical protein
MFTARYALGTNIKQTVSSEGLIFISVEPPNFLNSRAQQYSFAVVRGPVRNTHEGKS